jgi:hypothetical protein
MSPPKHIKMLREGMYRLTATSTTLTILRVEFVAAQLLCNVRGASRLTE